MLHSRYQTHIYVLTFSVITGSQASKVADLFQKHLTRLDEDPSRTPRPSVALVCGAVDAEALPVETRAVFMHEVRMKAPGAVTQSRLLASLLRLNDNNANTVTPNDESAESATTALVQQPPKLDLASAMKLLGSCSVGELAAVASFAASQRAVSDYRHNDDSKNTVAHSTVPTIADIEAALAVVPTGPSSMVDQPKIPNVRWEDIGGW